MSFEPDKLIDYILYHFYLPKFKISNSFILFKGCEKTCPPNWECNDVNLVQEYGQCGGQGYEGNTKCTGGLNCYIKVKLYLFEFKFKIFLYYN